MLMTEMLRSYAKEFCFVDKVRKPDGAGGYIPTWKDGAKFTAIMRHDTTVEAQIAEKSDGISTYTFIVSKKIALDNGDVIKRLEDGNIYLITGDSKDKTTPEMSALDMSVAVGKRWELTT